MSGSEECHNLGKRPQIPPQGPRGGPLPEPGAEGGSQSLSKLWERVFADGQLPSNPEKQPLTDPSSSGEGCTEDEILSFHVQKREEKTEEQQGCRENELRRTTRAPPLFHCIRGQKGWKIENKGLPLSCPL